MAGFPWFRFYSETMGDKKFPKIARTCGVSKAEVVGAWALILCAASESPERGSLYVTFQERYTVVDVTELLGFTKQQTQKIILAFIRMEMLACKYGVFYIVNWDKRQYASDNSSERVQKFREKKKLKQQCNVSVTLPDSREQNTENRIQITESEIPKRKPAAPPIVFPVSLDCELFRQSWEEWLTFRAETKHKLTPTTIRKQLAQLGKFPVSTAIAMIDQSIEKGWMGLFEVKSNGNGYHHDLTPDTSQIPTSKLTGKALVERIRAEEAAKNGNSVRNY